MHPYCVASFVIGCVSVYIPAPVNVVQAVMSGSISKLIAPLLNLGGKVDNYQLQFDADTQLEFDETLIPTGKTVSDTRFLTPRIMEDCFLDNSFVLQQNGSCVLSYNGLVLKVKPDATYPILQVYTPPHRNSIAIENLSGAPDNFNNKINLLNVEPNQWYAFTTSYQLSSL